jgi:hypothetical protein
MMTFSFLFGDNNVQVRLENGQKAHGEFIGTYMNHVHILIGEKIIYYACDDIISITSANEGLSYGKGYDYDCSINTVTADILFPPELDPMTGEMAQMLPDVFNPDIPKLAVEKATPVVQKPTAKVEAGGVSAVEDFVIIGGVKYARIAPEEELQANMRTDFGSYRTDGDRGATLSQLEIQSMALMNARKTHVGPGWGLLGLAGCGTGLMGGIMGGEMAEFPGFLIGGALGLSLPSLFASGSASSISVPYYPTEIKTQNEKQLYKDAYVKETGLLRRRSTVTGTGVGLVGFGAFMLVLISSF